MRNSTKVSIIVPVYNTEIYLPRCLDSIINQTFHDIEIICVNDGSTDGSSGILKEYASNDKRITVLESANRGAGAARNIGLSHINSEYIMFVDSDDYIEENAIEIFYSKMTENNVDLVVSHLSCVTADDKLRQRSENYEKYYESCRQEEGIHKLKKIEGLRSGPVAKMFKRSIITSKNIKFPEGIIQEDEAWNWFYMSQIKKYYFLNNSYYYRVVREDSVMGKRDFTKKGCKDMLDVLEHIYSYLNKYGLYGKFKKQYSNYFYTHTRHVYNRVARQSKGLVMQNINEMIKRQRISDTVSLIQQIFSIRNEANYKVIRILGIKIKLRNKRHKNYIPFIQYIFSVRNEGNCKIVRLLGAKIKIKNKDIVM